MASPTILLTRNQFGYQTDYFNYSKYLSKPEFNHQVINVCIDAGHPKVNAPNVEVVYVADTSSPKIVRWVKLILAGLHGLSSGHTVVVKYFPGASLLRLSRNKKNLVIDIRTLSVSPNPLRRMIQDLLCRLEVRGNDRITVVSNSIAQKLCLKNWHLLPLGANLPISTAFSEGKDGPKIPLLVYAGTLDGRDLTTLIRGFEKASHCVEARLRIIGSGKSEHQLISLVVELGISDKVEFLGYIPHGEEFSKLLKTSSFGIVHVPPTDYYAGQPSTKLYEYWAHGLPVLCSNYPSGAAEIQDGTGLLYNFNSDDLRDCIVRALKDLESFDSEKIYELALSHTWEKVVQKYLVPVLDLYCED